MKLLNIIKKIEHKKALCRNNQWIELLRSIYESRK